MLKRFIFKACVLLACSAFLLLFSSNSWSLPLSKRSAVTADGFLQVNGKKIFPLGWWTGHPYFADGDWGDIDFLQNRPSQGSFGKPFNTLFVSIGQIESGYKNDLFNPTPNPLDPAEFPYDQEYCHWSYDYQFGAKRLRGEGAPFPDIHVFPGFPYLHEFNNDQAAGAKTLYDFFFNSGTQAQIDAARANIAGWYSFDEPTIPKVAAKDQLTYTRQVDWSDAWMASKNDYSRVWGPVHYGPRYLAPEMPYGPAKANGGHQLYMVDIYDARLVGDITHKAVQNAGKRSPIIWLALHQPTEKIFLEYCFWEAIVHGAKGIIWYRQPEYEGEKLLLEGGVENTYTMYSPERGNPYDGESNGKHKFDKTLGQRVEDVIYSFRSFGIQNAILNGTAPGARFVPLNTAFTQNWTGFNDDPIQPQPFQSSLDFDLNGRVFKVGTKEWIVVVVNDGEYEFSPGGVGYAKFKIAGLPAYSASSWLITLIDGNDTENFSSSVKRTSTSTEITIEDFLNYRGYRIFRIKSR
jgi:hypothetical protein